MDINKKLGLTESEKTLPAVQTKPIEELINNTYQTLPKIIEVMTTVTERGYPYEISSILATESKGMSVELDEKEMKKRYKKFFGKSTIKSIFKGLNEGLESITKFFEDSNLADGSLLEYVIPKSVRKAGLFVEETKYIVYGFDCGNNTVFLEVAENKYYAHIYNRIEADLKNTYQEFSVTDEDVFKFTSEFLADIPTEDTPVEESPMTDVDLSELENLLESVADKSSKKTKKEVVQEEKEIKVETVDLADKYLNKTT